MAVTYKIGEAAAKLQLKTHVLRFWETEFPQIVPLRTEKGQRLYTEENLNLLRQIKHLLHEQGHTIEGAKKSLAADAARGIRYDVADNSLSLLTNDAHSGMEDIPGTNPLLHDVIQRVTAPESAGQHAQQPPDFSGGKTHARPQQESTFGAQVQAVNQTLPFAPEPLQQLSARAEPTAYDEASLGKHLTQVVRRAVAAEHAVFYADIIDELNAISGLLQSVPGHKA